MFKSEDTAKKIEEILKREFSPLEFELEDQSYLHAGHKGAGGGGHFFVFIKSAKFNNQPLLARQRMVIAAVQSMMDKEIHALSMKCVPAI